MHFGRKDLNTLLEKYKKREEGVISYAIFNFFAIST